MRSARRFVVKLILSGGGVLRSAAVESSPSPSSRVFGSVGFGFPSPVSAWRSSRRSELLKMEVVFDLAMKMVARGVGSLEPATGDFPSAEGLLSIQAIKECSGGGAPPAASGSSSTSGSSGLICNFSFCRDLVVKPRW